MSVSDESDNEKEIAGWLAVFLFCFFGIQILALVFMITVEVIDSVFYHGHMRFP